MSLEDMYKEIGRSEKRKKMKNFLKKLGKWSLVTITYIPAVTFWILFTISYRILNLTTHKLGYQPALRWHWLGIDAEDTNWV